MIARKQRLRWATHQTSTLGSYTKETPTLVHQTRTTTLVPRPKLSIASSDREFYISSADWKSYPASYAFLCTSQANSASGSFKQHFALNLHSDPVVHFALIDAN